tara:strand:+ start:152 stop:424 length:273 start_codon:yes stop_codon:yes gene_type:complete
MKEETKYFIEELERRQHLEELYNQTYIEFDTYFKDSGKIEVKARNYSYDDTNYSKIVKAPEEYVEPPTLLTIKEENDMTKYKLKKDRVVW